MRFADLSEWLNNLTSHSLMLYVDRVEIDQGGNAIGKRLPVAQLAGILERGIPVFGAMQLVDFMGNTTDPMGHVSDAQAGPKARPLFNRPTLPEPSRETA